MSFRFVTTINVTHEGEIPARFTGRVRMTANGALASITWLNRGEMEDPGPRIPAYSRYRPSGKVKQIRHYRLGRLHDPSRGVPAVQGFFANGMRRYEEHYRYGRRHDHEGRAAIAKWRQDGTLRTELHYYEGLRIEAVSPAVAV